MTPRGHRTHMAGFALLLLLTVVLSSALAGPRTAFATLAGYGIFILPGILLFFWMGTPVRLSLIYGAPLGMALTSLVVVICVGYGGWNETRVALSYVVLVLLLYAASRYVSGTTNREMPLEEIDDPSGSRVGPSLFVYLIVGAYMALAFLPLSRVGTLTEDGYAFTGLFGHDYIMRASESVALSNALPPDNYYFNGVKVQNYYILGYILPASVYKFLHQQGNISGILGTICLANIPFFCLLLYEVQMRYSLTGGIRSTSTEVQEGRRMEILFLFLLFCYSYHWVFVLGRNIVERTGPEGLRKLFASMNFVSQSWFRDFILEPQTVLALMFTMLLMLLLAGHPSPLRGLVNGILLAAMALTDVSVFLIVGAAYAVWSVITCLSGEERGGMATDAAATFLAGTAVGLLMVGCRVIGMTEYSNRILFRPYTLVIVSLPVFLFLNLGVYPLAAAMKSRGSSNGGINRFLIPLALAALFFMLFVTESLEGNVILRKSLKVMRLPVYIMAVRYLLDAWGSRAFKVLIACLVISLPTMLTDIVSLTDITNRRVTTYVPRDYMEAALWIKANTPTDAVVQSAIEYPGYFEYSLTIAFGERKAALGHWKAAFLRYPNRRALDERVRQIKRLFLTDDAEERYRLARTLGIGYILIGPRENEIYPGSSRRYTSDEKHFRKIFSTGAVEMFQAI